MDTQTRHALKQDRLVEATKTSVDWFQENRSRVITAVIAAVICLAIVVAGLVLYGKRSAAAELALARRWTPTIRPWPNRDSPPPPGKGPLPPPRNGRSWPTSSLYNIANQYGLFEAGKTARYFAGLTAIDMGQTGTAETYLKQVADGHDAALASLAKLALANLYQQTNRSGQAVELLQQLIAKPTSTVPADAARLQLAALYEKTNPAEANRIYAQLKSSKTAAGQIAAQKLQQK